MKRKILCCALFLLITTVLPSNAQVEQYGSVEALVKMLEAKGVITTGEAEAFKSQFTNSGKLDSPPVLSQEESDRLIDDISAEVVKRIGPLVEDSVDQKIGAQPIGDFGKQELIEDVSFEVAQRISPYIEARLDKSVNDKLMAQELGKANHWVNRIRFGGDMRLRYQGDFFDDNNHKGFVDPANLSLTLPQETRNRGRIRVRISATAQINEQVEAVVKLSTGNETDPVSTNDTLGDYMNKDSIVFDQAYAKWKSKKIPVTAWGGRIPNPWFSTNLVWDSDLNFEGIAATYRPKLTERTSGFLTLGAFQIDEFATTTKDKYLLGAQLGLTSNISDGFKYKIGAAYYDYQNITGEGVSSDCQSNNCESEPQFLQKGNTLFYLDPGNTTIGLAADFNELNFTGELDVSVFDPIHVIFSGDYVQNIGYDSDEVSRKVYGNSVNSSGDLSVDEGYKVGLSVGYPKVRDWGQWKTFLYYRYLEADAVLDAFTDSDFHLGGTHNKGWILGGEMGLAQNTWMRTRWLTSDEISGPQFSVDSVQVDLNMKY